MIPPKSNIPDTEDDVVEVDDINPYDDQEYYEVEDDASQVYPTGNDGTQLPMSFGGRANRKGTAKRTRVQPRKLPVMGVGDKIGERDSSLVVNVLPEDLAQDAFRKMRDEVEWNTMYHRGGEVPRLVAVEGEVEEDGSFPIYRHPADESPPLRPWSPTVALIREEVQKKLGHRVNHVLIQLYRNGKDAISEHSDKTIDIVHGSNIVNVSLGAQRTMTLKAKKDWAKLEDDNQNGEGSIDRDDTVDPNVKRPPRAAQKVPLPHNSMFVLGPQTNARWLHSINPDNRPLKSKSPEERAQGGERISLTFRHIGTFLTKDEKWIYGQGAKGKKKENAQEVVNGSERESSELIAAFGDENHRSDFDWNTGYGEGSNVLHFKIASESA